MRCNTCNKFVSYSDSPDIEIDTESIESNDVNADLTIYLTCSECGEQLKQANASFEFSIDSDHECDPTAEVHEFQGEQFLIQDSSAEGSQLDKSSWQATVNFTIHCARCDSTFEADTFVDIANSEFEEI